VTLATSYVRQNEQQLGDNCIVVVGQGEPSLFGAGAFVESVGRFFGLGLGHRLRDDRSMVLATISAHVSVEDLEHVFHGFAKLIKQHLLVHCLLVII
jgi:hypothetical protein